MKTIEGGIIMRRTSAILFVAAILLMGSIIAVLR